MVNANLAARTFTFVLAGGKGERLHPLTASRAKPAVSIAGVYRLIDFTLSNCYNSGLQNLHILTQHHSESVHDCVREFGAPGFQQPNANVFVLCPPRHRSYSGTADAVFQNLPFVRRDFDYVLILSSDHLYKMDYRDLLRFHVEMSSEVTIAATAYPAATASAFGVLETNSDSRLLRFDEKPPVPKTIPGRPSHALVNMGIYVFSRPVLQALLTRDANQNSADDFGRDIIPSLIGRARVYNFTERGSGLGTYWRDVGTLDTYYAAGMDLLQNSAFNLKSPDSWPVYNSTRLDFTAAHHALHSLVAKGAGISRSARVVRSIVSCGAYVAPRASVEDSILLPGVRIGVGARVRNAILDHNARVAGGMDVGYNAAKDHQYGFVTAGGITVIPGEGELGERKAANHPAPFEETTVLTSRPVRNRYRTKTQRAAG